MGSMKENLEAEERIMKAAAPLQLREAGQSLWLDNITRDLLTSGTLKRYIDELSITGLTSNPRSSTMPSPRAARRGVRLARAH